MDKLLIYDEDHIPKLTLFEWRTTVAFATVMCFNKTCSIVWKGADRLMVYS